MHRLLAVLGRYSSLLLALLGTSLYWAIADEQQPVITAADEGIFQQGNILKQQGLSAEDLALLNQLIAGEDREVVKRGQSISQQAPSDPDRQLIDSGSAIKQQPLAAETQKLVESAISLNAQPFAEADQALIEQGREIVERAQGEYQQSTASGDPITREPPSISFPSIVPSKPRPTVATEPTILVFASWSLGEKGLNELLEAAAHYPHATVVLRGVPAGMNIGQGLKGLQALAAKKNPVPNIIIDPLLFNDCQVSVIPTIVLLKPGTPARQVTSQQILASVKGLADPTWLLHQVAGGARGDQGVHGPLTEIKEPDLLLVMQSKVMEIDWEAKKAAAITKFWQKQPFYELATARKSRRRVLDPTIVITDDIKGAEGQIIAAKGSRINPLSLRPFTQAVVIFDPLDQKQLKLVQQALPSIQKAAGAPRVTYIATRFCRDQGWDFYQKVTDALAAPVYLLTPDVIERFALQYTPAIISATDQQFVVQELAHEK